MSQQTKAVAGDTFWR